MALQDDKFVTVNKSFECEECKNTISIQEELSEGSILECQQCGIEYEVDAKVDGEYRLFMVEEEK